MGAQDKTAVLKRVLGQQVAGAVLGQGLLGRLVQSYVGAPKYPGPDTGGYPGGYGGGGGGYPTPGGNGRWEPSAPTSQTPSGNRNDGYRPPVPPAPGVTVNPDDTEY